MMRLPCFSRSIPQSSALLKSDLRSESEDCISAIRLVEVVGSGEAGKGTSLVDIVVVRDWEAASFGARRWKE